MSGSLHRGHLRIPGTDEEARATFVVQEAELRVEVAGTEVARWPTDQVEVDLRPDGVHLAAGDERIVAKVRDAVGLAEAIQAEVIPITRARRRRLPAPNWSKIRERLSVVEFRWVLAAIGVVTTLVVAVVATGALGRLLTLGGMFALVLAGLAVADDPEAYRFLPHAITEKALVIGGFIAVAVGLALIFLD